MVDIDLTDEQKMIRNAVRDFAQAEIAPRVREIDEGGKIPLEILAGLAKLNLFGISYKKEYGGIGADPVTVGIVAEELARADISCAIPTMYLVQASWGYVFQKYGTELAAREVLPDVMAGTSFIGIGATEPDTGSDLGNMKTKARKDGGNYILNGEKMFISGVAEVMSQLPSGGGYVTLVKTDPDAGTRGMSLFYIPLKTASGVTEGVQTTSFEDWGRSGISTGGFALVDVEIPGHYLVGEENRGFYLAMEGFDYARAIIAVVCCGAAMACIEKAMDYLKLRTTFGTPIGKYQGVQFKLAENWAKLDALRLLAYKALELYGRQQETGSPSRFEVTKACAEAKLLAPATAFEAINDAIQWYGAYGYTTECGLDMALRAVRSYYWAEGAREIMHIIVARELLGKEYVAYR